MKLKANRNFSSILTLFTHFMKCNERFFSHHKIKRFVNNVLYQYEKPKFSSTRAIDIQTISPKIDGYSSTPNKTLHKRKYSTLASTSTSTFFASTKKHQNFSVHFCDVVYASVIFSFKMYRKIWCFFVDAKNVDVDVDVKVEYFLLCNLL